MAEDRRVQRTRKLLREALMELVLEKGYDAITVQDITDRANLGRATLYLHYRDKEDLLYNSLEEIIDELTQLVESRIALATDGESLSPYQIAFTHAAENADLYRVLLSGQGATNLQARLRDYIAGTVQLVIEANLPKGKPDVPVEVASNYLAGALLMHLEWWLRKDMPYSAEEMAAFFTQLSGRGMRDAMGLQAVPGFE